MRRVTLIILILITVMSAQAQEVTAVPATPNVTATPASQIVVTTIDPDGNGSGQLVLVDYTVTAGESIIAVLLVALLMSLWGVFFFVIVRGKNG